MKEEDNQYIKLIKAEAKKLKASDKNEQDIITIYICSVLLRSGSI